MYSIVHWFHCLSELVEHALPVEQMSYVRKMWEQEQVCLRWRKSAMSISPLSLSAKTPKLAPSCWEEPARRSWRWESLDICMLVHAHYLFICSSEIFSGSFLLYLNFFQAKRNVNKDKNNNTFYLKEPFQHLRTLYNNLREQIKSKQHMRESNLKQMGFENSFEKWTSIDISELKAHSSKTGRGNSQMDGRWKSHSMREGGSMKNIRQVWSVNVVNCLVCYQN